MKLYNTLNRRIEKFEPNEAGVVNIYTCGPTVYHYAHIGNLRTYIFEDVLEKTLRYLDYKVNRCMNITDVGHLTSDSDTGEDKMAKGALREGKTVYEIAEYYTDAFFRDAAKLNIRKPDIIVKASHYIDQYVEMIKVLLEKGYAYKSGSNIYFEVDKYPKYYQLANMKKEDLIIAKREEVEEDKNKKSPLDFVLWFNESKFENQDMRWQTELGFGYPGWHIECSAIAINTLGEYLDIHCGGVDNIFPHHTNEIAQSEAYIGHNWCNYWLHGEHLNDKSGKMSKSKGDILTVSKLEENSYLALAYRYFCLESNYRKQLVFTWENLTGAQNSYQKLLNKYNALKDNPEEQIENIEEYIEEFKEHLKNDLNTANCVSLIYKVFKSSLNEKSKKKLIEEFDKVLSILPKKKEVDEELKKYIESKIELRKQYKIEKNYDAADEIRKNLENEGIYIKDTKDGVEIEIK